MKHTPDSLAIELAILRAFEGVHHWTAYGLAGRRRRPHRPNILALHPTGRALAIYARPGPLRPSRLPTTERLPAGLTPVVWHPDLLPQIRAWLELPTPVDPPGALPAPTP